VINGPLNVESNKAKQHSEIITSTNVKISVQLRSNPLPIKIQSNSAVKYPQFSTRIQFCQLQYMLWFIRGTLTLKSLN